MKIRIKKLMVICPMHRSPNPKTVNKLMGTVLDFASLRTEWDIITSFAASPDVVYTRNKAGKGILESGADASLWLDDDQDWPLSHDKFNLIRHMIESEKEFISGIYFSKRQPVKPMVGFDEPDGTIRYLDDPDLVVGPDPQPFRADYTGFGCVFALRSVFEKVAALSHPERMFNKEVGWLDVPGAHARLAAAYKKGEPELKKEVGRLIREADTLGEDWSFCRRAKEAGVELWMDPRFQVGHHGDYCYTVYDWLNRLDHEAAQEAAKEQEQAAV